MEFEERAAIFQQIAQRICEEILAETWPESARLPSIREVATQYAVNPNTVVRTYAELETQGIIRKQRGVGYFVTDDAQTKIKDRMRSEFVERQLPTFFRTIENIGISLAEVEAIYNQEQAKE